MEDFYKLGIIEHTKNGSYKVTDFGIEVYEFIGKHMHEHYVKEVTKLYEEILKRKPDKTGLFYFVSKLDLKNMSLEDVKKSLLNSEEGQAIANFSHYADKYWNNLNTVSKYINKLTTDNENTHWIEDLHNRFSKYIPFEDVLIVGCGNGWLERRLYDQGVGKHFDSFDISEKYIQEAEKEKGNRPIQYFIDNINDLQNIPSKKYDAVFNFAILHHATEIDSALKKISECLKPEGLMFNEEYVGPAKNQYSDEHLELMIQINSDLPEQFRSQNHLRPPLENFRIEPTEAIHSDLVRPIFEKYFDIVYERNFNGGIAYQILWNNIEKFDNDDLEAKKWLEYLLENDRKFSSEGKVPNLFWYGVGNPKKTVS
jgi:SAM-dependent methyltransferase